MQLRLAFLLALLAPLGQSLQVTWPPIPCKCHSVLTLDTRVPPWCPDWDQADLEDMADSAPDHPNIWSDGSREAATT